MVRLKGVRRGLPALISLRRVEELASIEDGQRLRIGATVPIRDVAAHPAVVVDFPALVESIRVFGSPQIRNVATLGGNLCNASPGADCAPPLAIYQAEVELRRNGSIRKLPVEDFLLGPGETALRPGELLTAILLERPSRGARSTYLRKGRVHMDLAIASVAVLVEMDGPACVVARVAAGAVAPVPRRLVRTEAIVEDSDVGPKTRALARSEAQTEVSPISDVRASEGYRRHLTGVFVERALTRLAVTDGVEP
jgi:carbon-monoxide dehydrogenase medium subunit